MKLNALSIVQFLADDGRTGESVYADYTNHFLQHSREHREIYCKIDNFLRDIALWDIKQNAKIFLEEFEKDDDWDCHFMKLIGATYRIYKCKPLVDIEKNREFHTQSLRNYFEQLFEKFSKDEYWFDDYDEILKAMSTCYPENCIYDRWDCEEIIKRIVKENEEIDAQLAADKDDED